MLVNSLSQDRIILRRHTVDELRITVGAQGQFLSGFLLAILVGKVSERKKHTINYGIANI